MTVDIDYPDPSADDWVGVFSPAKHNSMVESFTFNQTIKTNRSQKTNPII